MRGQGFFRQKARDKDAEGAERPQAGVQANEETGRWQGFFPFSHQSEDLRPVSGGPEDEGWRGAGSNKN